MKQNAWTMTMKVKPWMMNVKGTHEKPAVTEVAKMPLNTRTTCHDDDTATPKAKAEMQSRLIQDKRN